MSAIGYLERIEDNVPGCSNPLQLGTSTPVGLPSGQCVSAWGNKSDTKTSDFSTTFPWGASRTGRQRSLSFLGLGYANPGCEELLTFATLGFQLC